MPRPRRGHLLPARRPGARASERELHRTGTRPRFFGLEVARLLGRERSSVYKSLHRLVASVCSSDEWEEGAGATG